MTSLFLGSGLGGGPDPDFTGRGGAEDSTEPVESGVSFFVSTSVVEGGWTMSTTASHKSWTSPERLSWNTMIAAVLDLRLHVQRVQTCLHTGYRIL